MCEALNLGTSTEHLGCKHPQSCLPCQRAAHKPRPRASTITATQQKVRERSVSAHSSEGRVERNTEQSCRGTGCSTAQPKVHERREKPENPTRTLPPRSPPPRTASPPLTRRDPPPPAAQGTPTRHCPSPPPRYSPPTPAPHAGAPPAPRGLSP